MINYETINLKPCPFCGATPIWGTEHSGMGNTNDYKYISCPNCKIRTDGAFLWNYTKDELDPLINKWNSRV